MDGLPNESTHDEREQDGYILQHRARHIEPGENPAVELIRSKINALYAEEPNARTEIKEAEATPKRSKHQEFMYKLSASGQPLADIQAAWHRYYVSLPDDEKREVWQEFYANNPHVPTPHTRIIQNRSSVTHPHMSAAQHVQQANQKHMPYAGAARHAIRRNKLLPVQAPKQYELPAEVAGQASVPARASIIVSQHEPHSAMHRPAEKRSIATLRKQIMRQVHASHSAQLKARQHIQSLAFGLGMGALVLLILLFGFFNELVIAPFIQPGSHAEATPIILAQGSSAPSATPEVIIPKINVQLPTLYGDSVTEADIQKTLEDGVAHYASTSIPGQQGNAAFFGHSSNNIFNKGKYKFAFVLLHELVPGDLFYLTYNGKVYTYRVFQKQVVQPTDTWVLNPVAGKTATATLITCDPPGTSLHRLVVWGEQIDPDPNGNSAPAAAPVSQQPQELSSNGPTLWGRFWHWATPW